MLSNNCNGQEKSVSCTTTRDGCVKERANGKDMSGHQERERWWSWREDGPQVRTTEKKKRDSLRGRRKERTFHGPLVLSFFSLFLRHPFLASWLTLRTKLGSFYTSSSSCFQSKCLEGEQDNFSCLSSQKEVNNNSHGRSIVDSLWFVNRKEEDKLKVSHVQVLFIERIHWMKEEDNLTE